MSHPFDRQLFAALTRAPSARSRRSSSWDRTGANRDYICVGPGETVVLLDQEGAGCITHFYAALVAPDLTDYRDTIVRCYWDGESEPSVEVPLGDFFGIAHCRVREYASAVHAVNGGFGGSVGTNLYLPMPFSEHARVTVENRSDLPLGGFHEALWFHIDYETYADLPPDALRFHAQWRQERPTSPVGDMPNVTLHEGLNLDGNENYVALDASGAGNLVGLILEIDNLVGGWYGEGDDMVFIDGEPWPPAIHGTGTEEIFGGGACPNSEYASPYTGFFLTESPDFSGSVAMYRWYLADPIHFRRRLKWTLEHGHANNFANDYSSVAMWYQTEPHGRFPALGARDELRPALGPDYEEAREIVRRETERLARGGQPDGMHVLGQIAAPYLRGDWRAVREVQRQLNKRD